jgi:hypothetical protein
MHIYNSLLERGDMKMLRNIARFFDLTCGSLKKADLGLLVYEFLRAPKAVEGRESQYQVKKSATERKKKTAKRKRPSSSTTAKRRHNPYMLFCADNRHRLREENPEFSVTELAVLLGAAWRDLGPDGQQEFRVRASELNDALGSSNSTSPAAKRQKKKKPKKKVKQKAAASEDEESSDDDSDDDEPLLINGKGIQERIGDAVEALLSAADLSEMSHKSVRVALYPKFGKRVVKQHKDAIKRTVEAFVLASTAAST